MNKVKSVFSSHSNDERTSSTGNSPVASRESRDSSNHLYGTESNPRASETGDSGYAGSPRTSSNPKTDTAASRASTTAGSTEGSGARTAVKDDDHTSPVTGRGDLTEQGGERRKEGGSLQRAIGDHQQGHGLKHANDIDASNADHDHQHLKHVTHNDVRHLETEEVERQREHERHVHHVQHHVQPVKDKEVRDEVHHNQIHPVTNVNEKHSSTEHDKAKYQALGQNFKNQETHRPNERTIVDLGEKVNEHTHHHVHHVIQPVVEREIEDRHRIHTVIPTKHVTHEAPVIHQSTQHEPMHIKDFMSKGGKLDSATGHGETGVLHEGDCNREVDGMGEDLGRQLGLRGVGEYESNK